MERRLRALEASVGGPPCSCQPLMFIAPNSWSDTDRTLWDAAETLGDRELHDSLVEKYEGRRPHVCPAHPGSFLTILVPAPPEVEEAPEEERAAWRALRGTDVWKLNRGDAEPKAEDEE